MARIPTYETYERQMDPEVAPSPLRSRHAPAGAFGVGAAGALSGLGQALKGAGDEAFRIAMKEQAAADEMAVLEASNEWSRRTNAFLNDPEKGLYNRQLKGASGIGREAQTFFEKMEQEISKGLRNDRQRELFTRYVMQNKTTRLNGVYTHERQEFQKYKNVVVQEAVDTSLDAIAANYTDESVFQAELDRAEKAILTQYGDMGEEVVTAKIRGVWSAAHTARLARILEKDPKAAAAYFEANKDRIEGSLHGKWTEEINRHLHVEWVQEQADAIASRFGSEGAAVAWIRKNHSGKKENDLVSAVKTRFSERREVAARAAAAQKEKEWELVEGAANLSDLSAALDRLGVSGPRKRALLKQAQRNLLTDFGLAADYVQSEEQLNALADQYGVTEGTRVAALQRFRAVQDFGLKDLAELSATEEEFVTALLEGGASEEEAEAARGVFRSSDRHKEEYKAAQDRADLETEWKVRDGIVSGTLTTRDDVMTTAAGLPSAKVSTLVKELEGGRDGADSYVTAEMKRQFKEAKFPENKLPLFMDRFQRDTAGIRGEDAVARKLKVGEELLKKYTAKERLLWRDTYVAGFEIPVGFTWDERRRAAFRFNADGSVDRWVPEE